MVDIDHKYYTKGKQVIEKLLSNNHSDKFDLASQQQEWIINSIAKRKDNKIFALRRQKWNGNKQEN